MRVAIVHDRAEMADALAEVVWKAAAGGECDVQTADDLLSARDLLRRDLFDLAIVDLTLPVRLGMNEPELRNAELLLREIFESPDVKQPGDVLGISREAGALGLIATTVGQHLMGCVIEDPEGSWRKAVEEKVRYVTRTRLARQAVINSAHDTDLVILTALDKEAAPYSDLFELREHRTFRNAKAFNFSGRDGRARRGALYSINRSGQAPTASAAQALITQLRPRLILMTGFCGGVKKRVSAGDLMTFNSVFAWDYGKWEDVKEGAATVSKFRPRPSPVNAEEEGAARQVRDMLLGGYKPPQETVTKVFAASGGKIKSWSIKPTAAASGSAVVTSLDTLQQIVGLDENIWAVEMESYAFYHACRNTPVLRPDYLCLKSVADFCNGMKSSKLHAACSLISASFASDFVRQHYDFG